MIEVNKRAFRSSQVSKKSIRKMAAVLYTHSTKTIGNLPPHLRLHRAVFT